MKNKSYILILGFFLFIFCQMKLSQHPDFKGEKIIIKLEINTCSIIIKLEIGPANQHLFLHKIRPKKIISLLSACFLLKSDASEFKTDLFRKKIMLSRKEFSVSIYVPYWNEFSTFQKWIFYVPYWFLFFFLSDHQDGLGK